MTTPIERALAEIDRGELAVLSKVVADLQQLPYFEIVQRMTAETDAIVARTENLVCMMAEAQERAVAAQLTPLISKILADNDAAMSRLAREIAPLLDQIAKQRFDIPPSLRYDSMLPPIQARPYTQELWSEILEKDRQIAERDARIASLEARNAALEGEHFERRQADAFGAELLPPVDPEWFSEN